MTDVFRNPIALLLGTGLLLGTTFPLGKIAAAAAVSPLLWALLVPVGGCAMLLPVLAAKRALSRPSPAMLIYAFISAQITFVFANFMVFTVIPHVGAGHTGLMFALSPVFTLALSLIFGMKSPGPLGMAGIGLGLIGAVLVTLSQGQGALGADLIWLLAALLIPLALACGNIYRTLAWPAGAAPDVLAFWSYLIAGLTYVALLVLRQGGLGLQSLAAIPEVTLAQVVIAGLTVPLFFRLQKYGGPVLLSQCGYVAAAVGLFSATMLLGESYAPATWTGAAVIACGIALTVLAQRAAPLPRPA